MKYFILLSAFFFVISAVTLDEELEQMFRHIAQLPSNLPIKFGKPNYCYDYWNRRTALRGKKCIFAHVFDNDIAHHSYDQGYDDFFNEYLDGELKVLALKAVKECEETKDKRHAVTIMKKKMALIFVECCLPPTCYKAVETKHEIMSLPTCLRGASKNDEQFLVYGDASTTKFKRPQACYVRVYIKDSSLKFNFSTCDLSTPDTCELKLEFDDHLNRYICCSVKVKTDKTDQNEPVHLLSSVYQHLGDGSLKNEFLDNCEGFGRTDAGLCLVVYDFKIGKYLITVPESSWLSIRFGSPFNATCSMVYKDRSTVLPILVCSCSKKQCDEPFYTPDLELSLRDFNLKVECEENEHNVTDRSVNLVMGCAIKIYLHRAQTIVEQWAATAAEMRQINQTYDGQQCNIVHKDLRTIVTCVCRPKFEDNDIQPCNTRENFAKQLTIVRDSLVLDLKRITDAMDPIYTDIEKCQPKVPLNITTELKMRLVSFSSRVFCYYEFDLLSSNFTNGHKDSYVKTIANEHVFGLPTLLCRTLDENGKETAISGCNCGVIDSNRDHPIMSCCCVANAFMTAITKANDASALHIRV
ncbi:hypothetical protein M3Y95_00262600 [Aphelenchoides besseyi]|nr:hypothetical protein M3Y95_00262600 [Aphelenchoides besseyi]